MTTLSSEASARAGEPEGNGRGGNGHGPNPGSPEWLVAREARRDGWTVFVYVVAAVALIASIVAVGFGSRAVSESKKNASAASPAAAGAGSSASAAPMVHLSEFVLDPKDVTAPSGGSVEVMNVGTVAHNLTIEGQNLATAMIDPGKSQLLSLSGLAPGTYTMFCSVPGHREAGMSGTLHVTAATGASAGSAPAAGGAMTADQMDAAMAASMASFPAKTEGLGGQDLAPTVLADGTKQFELTAKVVKWEIEPGKFVDAWTYNGTVPGPTLRVSPGDKVRVIIHNNLPESTSIHFHGIKTPNAMDGVPPITQPPIKPGQSFTYEWTAQTTPAVGMYHSHQDAVKQVPDGLAGAFIIGSEPVPAGVQVTQQQIMMLNDSGTLGFSINGKSFPATAPIVASLGDWVEVHYLNEGVMAHPMHLHGLTQTIIAKDGFPVPQPYDADTVLVGPGERYTVLVHADTPGTWVWHCHILPHAENATGMFGMVTAMIVK